MKRHWGTSIGTVAIGAGAGLIYYFHSTTSIILGAVIAAIGVAAVLVSEIPHLSRGHRS